jgi:hypothetical protein
MRYNYLVILMLSLVLICCKKEETQAPSQDPPSGPAAGILLKDIVIPHLPSPYYHFEYNTDGIPSAVSFASGFYTYNILYSGNKILEMKSNSELNKFTLQYTYDSSGKVSRIAYLNANGVMYRRVSFTYDGQKLFKAEREVNPGSGFIAEKSILFLYQADGNLLELVTHHASIPAAGQTETTYSDRFEEYDDKPDTDGFSLLHEEFFDHVLLLPGVQFRKNNPLKIIHTGDGINYKIDYTYTYNSKDAPLSRIGKLLWLNGADSGKQADLSAFYSYY